MYNIKLYDYVPEPQPVSSDHIVAAHYYAAWKKGAAGLHNAFFDLHDYPERTPTGRSSGRLNTGSIALFIAGIASERTWESP